MALSTERLAQAYREAGGVTKQVLYNLLRESLGPQESLVMEVIRCAPGLSSMGVADKLGVKQNHADNILKRLYKWGLLLRRYNEGGWFEWEVKWG